MTATLVHLRHYTRPNRAFGAFTACGLIKTTWTTDPQAVTCPACIDAMNLQPA